MVDDRSRVSLPGAYRGYCEPVANGFLRSSEYLNVDDGCRIAVDIFRPTMDGELLNTSMPTILQFTGYRRAWTISEKESLFISLIWPNLRPGDFASVGITAALLPDKRTAAWPSEAPVSSLQALADWVLLHGSPIEYLLLHGYNAVIADTRATGASFGTASEHSAVRIGRDIAEVAEALAGREWSNGAFGMVGASWMGAVQYMAATYGGARLKAIFPQVAPFDQYLSLWPGGIFNIGLMAEWLAQTQQQDRASPAAPVDEDRDGSLRDLAVGGRESGAAGDAAARVQDTLAAMGPLARDHYQSAQKLNGVTFADGSTGDLAQEPLDFGRANASAIPIYHFAGTWDIYGFEAPIAQANMRIPSKLAMGPWHHANTQANAEALRWFDYWLKGIDNGVMSEPRVTFAVSRADKPPLWRWSERFPPTAERQLELSLNADGRLSTKADGGARSLKVDPRFTAGLGARGGGYLHGARLSYDGLANPEGALQYLGDPLEAEEELVGYPILTLELASTCAEAQVFAWLLSVAEDGRAWMVSEGQLDLKYRLERAPPHENLGLPWRSFLSTDAAPLPCDAPVTARFALNPIAWRAEARSRLVLVVAGADRDNAWRAADAATPVITLFAEGSRLILPVMSTMRAPLVDGAFTPSAAAFESAMAPFVLK